MAIKKKERLEILAEDIQSKFELVLEGHAGINRRLDELTESVRDERQEGVLFQKALSNQISQVETNLRLEIRGVAADLAEHRADTEAHRTSYRVSEPS
jgi:hypothetical protein